VNTPEEVKDRGPNLGWLRTRVGPLWPYLTLIAVPAAAFILPAVFGGHLLMTGDNLQQNYPLHVLVGSMLRKGQLPFWNQYIFSGTPLLAGFNAGAVYPLMGLFVILPDRVAWIATEVILFSVLALGMYVFLRALVLSTAASFLGAATFAFSGVVLSQVNHIDMTEGFVAIPWMLLALLHILRDGRWRWSILLGIGFATVILGGAPEAMLDEAILIIAYGVISTGVDPLRWWRFLSRGAVAAGLALSLAAIQWLPGLNAIANSQRASSGHGFAAAGGYPLPFGVLSIVPYLFGGYGHLGESTFFSHYNLPEVGIYLGLLPIVAVVALLHPRWPSRLPARERLNWYFVGVLGFLLALADETPVGRLFNQLPLYGHQRLQSRNMIDVSVAVCVLFAGWLDRKEGAAAAEEAARYDRWAVLVPLVAIAGLAGWALIAPSALLVHLAGVTPRGSLAHTVREATLIALGVSIVAAVLVWLRSRLTWRQWIVAAGVFVAADIGTMAVTSQLASYPYNPVVAGSTTLERYLAAHLVPGGRIDVYDPQQYSRTLGVGSALPDVNVLAHLPSVSGYASIVNGNYSALTNTHTQGDLNVAQLKTGTLDGLDLEELATVPEYFLLPLSSVPVSLAHVQQIPESRGGDPVLPLGNGPNFNDDAYPFYPPPRDALGPGASSEWLFGESLAPTRATLLFDSDSRSAQIRFGKVNGGGVTTWGPSVPVPSGAVRVEAALPPGAADGLAVQVLSGRLPRHQAVVSIAGRAFELDGSLSSAITPESWRQEGVVDGSTVLVRLKPPTPIYALAAGAAKEPRVRVLTSQTKIEKVRVTSAQPVTIVRDVAWDPGWDGSVSVNGHGAQSVRVTERGLVEQVRVPAGNDVVTFAYRPPHLLVATVLSCGALAVLFGLLVLSLARRVSGRRRRHVVVMEGPGEPAGM
jgi:hypothetical protein